LKIGPGPTFFSSRSVDLSQKETRNEKFGFTTSGHFGSNVCGFMTIIQIAASQTVTYRNLTVTVSA
jgi:hypothetical protein